MLSKAGLRKTLVNGLFQYRKDGDLELLDAGLRLLNQYREKFPDIITRFESTYKELRSAREEDYR